MAAFFLFPEQARHLDSEHLYICHCLHINTLLSSQAQLAPFSSFRSQVIIRSSFSTLPSEASLLSHPQVILWSYFFPSTQENLKLSAPPKLESELPGTGVLSVLLTLVSLTQRTAQQQALRCLMTESKSQKLP